MSVSEEYPDDSCLPSTSSCEQVANPVPSSSSSSSINTTTCSSTQHSKKASSAYTTRSHGTFPQTLYFILSMNYGGIITWLPDGESFRIHDRIRLEIEVLPNYFKHKNFSSFQRQLSIYDFTHTPQSLAYESSYNHRYFKKGREDLLKFIRRVPTKLLQNMDCASELSKRTIVETSVSSEDETHMNSFKVPKKKSIGNSLNIYTEKDSNYHSHNTILSSSSFESNHKNKATTGDDINYNTTYMSYNTQPPSIYHDQYNIYPPRLSLSVNDSVSLSSGMSPSSQSNYMIRPFVAKGQEQFYQNHYHQVYPSYGPISHPSTTISNSSSSNSSSSGSSNRSSVTNNTAHSSYPSYMISSTPYNHMYTSSSIYGMNSSLSNNESCIRDQSTPVFSYSTKNTISNKFNTINDIKNTTQSKQSSPSQGLTSFTHLHLPSYTNSNNSVNKSITRPSLINTSSNSNNYDHTNHISNMSFNAQQIDDKYTYTSPSNQYTYMVDTSTNKNYIDLSTLFITLGSNVAQVLSVLPQSYPQVPSDQWQLISNQIIDTIQDCVYYQPISTTCNMTSNSVDNNDYSNLNPSHAVPSSQQNTRRTTYLTHTSNNRHNSTLQSSTDSHLNYNSSFRNTNNS